MKHLIIKSAALIALAMGAIQAEAGNLWIIGDATPYGWSTDDATALLSTADAPDVYTGTIYLKANADFKFMTTTEFGGKEYGAATGATLTDGTIAIASGSSDNGYGKIQVTENANYRITVDTGTMTASISKSEYQASEIKLCSLFLVGSATPGEWSVDNGTPLYQDQTAPYVFKTSKQDLKAGTFKIATVIKGGGTWDAKYWYFRNADNSGKIALGQDGDLQWDIADATKYDITVNLQTSDIEIVKSSSSSIANIGTDSNDNAPVEYYTPAGIKVADPAHGIYIKRQGTKTSKIYLK